MRDLSENRTEQEKILDQVLSASPRQESQKDITKENIGKKLEELTDTEKDKLLSLTRTRFSATNTYCSSKFIDYFNYWRIYKMLMEIDSQSGENARTNLNINLPFIYGYVQKAQAKLTEPLFSTVPCVGILAKNRKDETAKENMITMARDYLSSREYQEGKARNNLAHVITGNSYEMDCWEEKQETVKEWGEEEIQVQTNSVEVPGIEGEVPVNQSSPAKQLVKKSRTITRSQYVCKFPSVFDCFPEPGVNEIQDMEYFIVLERQQNLKDLERQTYTNIDENGQQVQKQVYDFTQLRNDNSGKTVQPVIPNDCATDYKQLIDVEFDGDSSSGTTIENKQDDVDSVCLMHVYNKGRMYTICNDRYLVRYVEDFLDRPRIPFRHIVYHQASGYWGVGIIEVLRNLNYLNNDIFNMGATLLLKQMQGRVLIHKDALIDGTSLESNKSGLIPLKGTMPVNQATTPLNLGENPTSNMLAMSSFLNGMAESTTAMADYSPGVQGTKATHKTARGLSEIRQELSSMQRPAMRLMLGAMCDQCQAIEWLSLQYLTSPQNFNRYNSDGKYEYQCGLAWHDIATEGRGLTYVIEQDPTFGDDTLQRQWVENSFPLAYTYNSYLTQTGDTESKKVSLEMLMRKYLRTGGYKDMTNIMVSQSGLNSPEQEFSMMENGQPVEPHPLDNHTAHIAAHANQLQDGNLIKGMQSGKIPPGIPQMIMQHIQQHQAMGKVLLDDPTLAGDAIKEMGDKQ